MWWIGIKEDVTPHSVALGSLNEIVLVRYLCLKYIPHQPICRSTHPATLYLNTFYGRRLLTGLVPQFNYYSYITHKPTESSCLANTDQSKKWKVNFVNPLLIYIFLSFLYVCVSFVCVSHFACSLASNYCLKAKTLIWTEWQEDPSL